MERVQSVKHRKQEIHGGTQCSSDKSSSTSILLHGHSAHVGTTFATFPLLTIIQFIQLHVKEESIKNFDPSHVKNGDTIIQEVERNNKGAFI